MAENLIGRSFAIERGNSQAYEVESGKSVRASAHTLNRRLIGLSKFLLGAAGVAATVTAVAITGMAGFLPGLSLGAAFTYLGVDGLRELVTGKTYYESLRATYRASA
ncbi:MAG: hypothetical protein Greene07147_587 [Parcubacteria group bacterium Greene0714_7]|nr:MAG: hypothetical protein Greene07147_587 [Parcubacteria group bacterium Greene0714_7]